MPSEALLPPGDSWNAIREGFRWRVPDRFNIAEACCTRWARAAPERTAIIEIGPEGTARHSYGWLEENAARLASVLAARGVGRGDRVAIILPQGPAVMLAHFAAYKLGAVAMPLFALFGPEALQYRLADSGACCAITDAAGAEKLAAIAGDVPSLTTVLSTDPAPGGKSLWEEIARARPLPHPAETMAEDPAFMIYTSGTTGPPKGVLHAQRALIGHLPSIETWAEGAPRRADIGWTPADWGWIGGLMDLAMPMLYYGAALVSHRAPRFDPEEALAMMGRQGVSLAFLPPTALRLMAGARVPGGLALRAVCSGGEALGEGLYDWGLSQLGAPINEVYGQTECNLVVGARAGMGVRRPGAVGKPVPGHEVAVLGPGGAPVVGEIGQIAVRAPDPGMFLRYWNQPEKTAAKFQGGWMLTGDLGQQDAEGYIAFTARDDDIISSSGYRIGPSEIEECLCQDEDVVMAAAVGLPDPVRGEVVAAFVVLREGAPEAGLEERLTARVRARISPHVAPRTVTVLGALPMTATGKILRRELKIAAQGTGPAR